MFQSLSGRIFLGLFAGLVLGSLVQYGLTEFVALQNIIVKISDGIGLMFIHAIMVMVAPLVFFSIVSGVLELNDLSSFGRLGSKTFLAYLINTCIAISLATLASITLMPGAGLNLDGQLMVDESTVRSMPNVFQLIVDIIPSNPVQAFASGNMLQVIFMAMMTGIVVKMLGKEIEGADSFFQKGNIIMTKMITLVMNLAPFGVCALMIKLGATLDVSTFVSVLKYILLILSLLFFWLMVLYPCAVALFSDIKPSTFRNAIQEQFLLLCRLQVRTQRCLLPCVR